MYCRKVAFDLFLLNAFRKKEYYQTIRHEAYLLLQLQEQFSYAQGTTNVIQRMHCLALGFRMSFRFANMRNLPPLYNFRNSTVPGIFLKAVYCIASRSQRGEA